MKSLLFLVATFFIFLFLAIPQSSLAKESSSEGIYIILDGSGSMWGKLNNGTHKITAARKVLKEYVKSDFSGKSLALRAYGHNRKSDCSDTELVVPFSAPDKVVSKISKIADGINPKGRTPISRSLRAALKDFGNRSGSIILISDGIETCDEDPCALMKEWRKKNIKIDVHVVGLGLQGKEKAAMECIAKTSGTDYQDAQSADELTAGLKKIHENTSHPEFALLGKDEADDPIPIEGYLTQGDAKKEAVKSNKLFQIKPGKFTLTAGVRTKNGNLYKPVSKEVIVKETGRTTITVNVKTPPIVRVQNIEDGKSQRGALVRAYQNGKELFKFRNIDTAFIEEGKYEFRTNPNNDNDLSLTQTIKLGDNLLTFKLKKTVRAFIQFVSSQTKRPFPNLLELRQNGKLKYKMRNTKLILPGSYDVIMGGKLTRYEKRGVVVSGGQPDQKIILEVPTGLATFIYQKADGSRDKDDRVFVNGQYIAGGVKNAIVPGKYYVDGWKNKGKYDRVSFEIKADDDKEIVIRGH